jgi:hypothetical protein
MISETYLTRELVTVSALHQDGIVGSFSAEVGDVAHLAPFGFSWLLAI